MIKIWKWFFRQSTKKMHYALFGFTAFIALASMNDFPMMGPVLTFACFYIVAPIVFYRIRGQEDVSQKV